MKRKLVSLLLVGTMSFSLLTGCSSSSDTATTETTETTETEVTEGAIDAVVSSVEVDVEATSINKEGYPISDELLEFDIAYLSWATHQMGYGEMDTFTMYEELSNIHINWTELPSESSEEKTNLLFASPDTLPDAFWGQLFSNDDILNYAAQDLIIPLNDLIEEYAPNLSAAMEDDLILKRMMTSADGNIYSLAGGALNPHLAVSAKMWINQDWLDKLDAEMPTTIDELYDVLVQMKGTDLNENGTDDEIPFTCETWNLVNFMAPWGVAGATIVTDGIVESGYLQEGFRDALIWYNKLYEEGLMETELFTQTTAQFFAKSSGDDLTYGFFVRSADFSVVGANNAEYYEAVPALTGDAGQVVSADHTYHVANKFTITKNCEDPAALIRWVDYFYDSGEGALLTNRGTEGLAYTDNGDGTYKILDLPDGSNGLAPGGTSPYYMGDNIEFNDADLDLIQATEDYYLPYIIEEYFPSTMTYTLAESEERLLYQSSIDTYAEEAIANFVTGNWDIEDDDVYNDFIETLQGLNIDRIVEINQTAYTRYMSVE